MNYPEGYRRILTFRRVLWLMYLAFIPIMMISNNLAPGYTGLVFFFYGFTMWIFMYIIPAFIDHCPWCSKPFFSKDDPTTFDLFFRWRVLLQSNCINCGMPHSMESQNNIKE